MKLLVQGHLNITAAYFKCWLVGGGGGCLKGFHCYHSIVCPQVADEGDSLKYMEVSRQCTE
jgi:hypothetical protein